MKIELTSSNVSVKSDDEPYFVSFPSAVLTDFLQLKPHTDPLLPRNCRYFSIPDNRTHMFVIEEDPQVRTIYVDFPDMVRRDFSRFASLGVYDTKGYSPNQKTFTLSFPYTIYIVTVTSNPTGWFELTKLAIFFRTSPLQLLSDQLYHLPILNRYKYNGTVCLSYLKGETINEVVSDAIGSFWSSEFNADVDIARSPHVPIVNNLFEWDYMTKKNPLFILNLDLEPSVTLKSCLDRSVVDISTLVQVLEDINSVSTTSPLLIDNGRDNLELDGFVVYRGDVIEFQNKELEVISFVSRNTNNCQETYIYGRVGDKKSFFKLTKPFVNAVTKTLEKKQVRSVSSQDGKTFSVGDVYYVQNQYFQISKIRPSIGTRDYEIICGNKMFMLSDFSRIAEKVDLTRYVGDIPIAVNRDAFKLYYKKCTIEEVTCENNNLHLKTAAGTLSPDYMINLEGLQEIGTKAYRIGSSISTLVNAFINQDRYIILEDESRDVDLTCSDKFSIKGFDIDLTFEVGDKVVYATTDPRSRLHIYEITNIQGSGESVVFTLRSTQTGEEKDVTYIDVSSVVALGQIRKVVLEYEGVSAGQRIVAKQSRIPCFPKREVNEIIAFVVDHVSEPLVLCSNGCTIWWSVFSSAFDILSKTSRMYRKELAPIKPLRLQLGDLVVSSDGRIGWWTRGVRSLEFPFYSFYTRPELQFTGIPEPRVPVKYATDPTFRTTGLSLGHGTLCMRWGHTVLDHDKLKREVFNV